MINNFLV